MDGVRSSIVFSISDAAGKVHGFFASLRMTVLGFELGVRDLVFKPELNASGEWLLAYDKRRIIVLWRAI
jgi:hypothetical protein